MLFSHFFFFSQWLSVDRFLMNSRIDWPIPFQMNFHETMVSHLFQSVLSILSLYHLYWLKSAQFAMHQFDRLQLIFFFFLWIPQLIHSITLQYRYSLSSGDKMILRQSISMEITQKAFNNEWWKKKKQNGRNS